MILNNTTAYVLLFPQTVTHFNSRNAIIPEETKEQYAAMSQPPNKPEALSTEEAVQKIDEQIEKRKKSTAFSWDNFIGYGILGGGVLGWMQQALGNSLARNSTENAILSNAETRKVYEVLSEADKAAMVTETMKNSPSAIARSIANHPTAWKAGMAAVGVGAVLAWEVYQQSARKSDADKDINDLNQLKQSWVDRVSHTSSPSQEHTK